MHNIELFLDEGKHYMMIVDPGIFPEKGYAPYDEGVKDDLFIKSSNGSVSDSMTC